MPDPTQFESSIQWEKVYLRLLAFTRVMARQTPDVFDGVSCEDLVQEVFEQFFNGKLRWQPEKGSLDKFLVGILKHKMIDRIRRDSRIKGSLDDPRFSEGIRHLDAFIVPHHSHLISSNVQYNWALETATIPAVVSPLSEISDDILTKLLNTAYFILGNERLAVHAVAKAVAQFPAVTAAQIDNRRTRYRAVRKRASYRPLTDKRALLHYLLLDELDQIERKEEASGRLNTLADKIRCYIKQIAKMVLNHNSFYAAVGITQILGDYTAGTALSIYDSVAPERSVTKTLQTVSSVKENFIKAIRTRFGDSVRLRKQGTSWRFISRKPSGQEVQLVRQSLIHFLPDLHETGNKLVGIHEQRPEIEGANELSRIRKFCEIAQFNELAALVGVGSFEERLIIPIFDGVIFAPYVESQTPPPVFDLAQVKRSIAHSPGYRVSKEDSELAELLAAAGDIQGPHDVNRQLAELLGTTTQDIVNRKKRLRRRFSGKRPK